MSDTLGNLIDAELMRRTNLEMRLPPVVYGVWVPGAGWLKDPVTRRAFADAQIRVAESAAQLYGAGAHVLPFDASLLALEAMFLECAAQRENAPKIKKVMRWLGLIR